MTAADPAQALTIVVPMAGDGARFQAAGYRKPKPFIAVAGRPMIEWVLDNLVWPGAAVVLIARAAHLEAEAGDPRTARLLSGCAVHTLTAPTEGSACTVLAAADRIPLDRPMLIANCDQLVRHGIREMIEDAQARRLDGSIMVFEDAGDPKWSFVRCDQDGLVVEVAEKKPISDLATVGIYYFATGRMFVDAARSMIGAGRRINNEFYTCPVYNEMIRDRRKIGVWKIARHWMCGLGTPEDLESFLDQDRVSWFRRSPT